jgi:hypothetical protein
MTNFSDYSQPGIGGAGSEDNRRSTRDEQSSLRDQARDWGQDLKSKASQMGDTLSQTARDQAAKAKEAAADMGAAASRKIEGVMQDQKNAGADYIFGVAQAINRAAGEFDQDIPQAARYIRKAGGQVESVASAVREREPRELLQDLEDFARRQPAVFFGGAMLLGFAALRFIKSAPAGEQQRPEGG